MMEIDKKDFVILFSRRGKLGKMMKNTTKSGKLEKKKWKLQKKRGKLGRKLF